MPKTSLSDAKVLKSKLNTIITKDMTVSKLATVIKTQFEDTERSDLIVGARTIRDYHTNLSDVEIANLNSTYPSRLLKALQIIEPELNSFDIRDQARHFFSTDRDSYEYEHLDRLVGIYDMFRPYWRKIGSNDFMRSRVRILRRAGHYIFSEHQRWPNKPYIEISAGYLFPSRNSIIAICKSRSGRNVKFLSIGSLRQDPDNFEKLDRFSGSMIATSDEPPHPGHGFCCIRNDKSHHDSDFISKVEMKKNRDLYYSIMLNQVHSEMDINEYKEFKNTYLE